MNSWIHKWSMLACYFIIIQFTCFYLTRLLHIASKVGIFITTESECEDDLNCFNNHNNFHNIVWLDKTLDV